MEEEVDGKGGINQRDWKIQAHCQRGHVKWSLNSLL